MSRTRRKFSPRFKADLCVELLKGEKDLNSLASENSLLPNLLRNWKKDFLEKCPKAFRRVDPALPGKNGRGRFRCAPQPDSLASTERASITSTGTISLLKRSLHARLSSTESTPIIPPGVPGSSQSSCGCRDSRPAASEPCGLCVKWASMLSTQR